MKILYALHQFYPEYQAGTEKFIYNIATMAQLNANKVKVVTYRLGEFSHNEKKSDGVSYEEYFYKSLPILAFKYDQQAFDINFATENPVGLSFARKILQREKPNLLHIGHLMRVFPFAQAALELEIPYILTLTDFFTICPLNTLAPTMGSLCNGPNGGEACARYCSKFTSQFIKERLDSTKRVLSGAKEIFVPSTFVANMIESEMNGIKVTVNNHGIRQSTIQPNYKTYDDHDSLKFASIGTLISHKGTHLAIQAFETLKTEHAELDIFGVGEKSYTDWLKSLARKSKVSFKGAFMAENLAKVLNDIDVLIVPSLVYETYSFVVHEALSAEIPVIVSDLGGMTEKVLHGENSYKFPAGNVDALRDIMQKILDKPSGLNRIKSNIRKSTLIPNIEQEYYVYQKAYKQIEKQA